MRKFKKKFTHSAIAECLNALRLIKIKIDIKQIYKNRDKWQPWKFIETFATNQ